jgi:coatomer protein complex subunit gamma
MLYLIIKELAQQAENSFAAANSLLKAMSSNTSDEFKSHAMRSLRRITDVGLFFFIGLFAFTLTPICINHHLSIQASMFGAMDRHLKQAVVDQSASIASSALVSGLHLSSTNADLVKRWSNEIQTALKNRYHMVQYHALALMYKLRQQDSLAVSKLVSSNISNFRSPLAHTLLIKYALRVLKQETSMTSERSLSILKYLDTCLTYKNDIIVLEAAKALCSLEQLTSEELTPAVTGMDVLFLFVPCYTRHLFFCFSSSIFPFFHEICSEVCSH